MDTLGIKAQNRLEHASGRSGSSWESLGDEENRFIICCDVTCDVTCPHASLEGNEFMDKQKNSERNTRRACESNKKTKKKNYYDIAL